MDFYAIWPAAVCLAIVLALVATRPFASADAPPGDGRSRIPTLDGLRGIVALAVVLHHGAIYHRYLIDGMWILPPSDFYTVLGQAGIGLFFMITGYLFWARVLRERGRPSWSRLAVGRLFRIAPVYLIAVVSMLALVAVATRFRLNVDPSELVQEIGRWLALGVFLGSPVNGLPAPQLFLAGVTWTLRYEWMFYASLPVLAVAARRPALAMPMTATALALAGAWLVRGSPWVMSPLEPSIACLFGCGMISAALHARGWLRSFPSRPASCTVVGLLAAIIWVWPDTHHLPALMLLGVAFHLIASDCSVFGLLTLRSTRRLGAISYGIYLLQGLALTVVFRAASLRGLALGSPIGHWVATLASMILLVCVATIVHAWVERPGIALGKRVADWRWPKLDSAFARRL